MRETWAPVLAILAAVMLPYGVARVAAEEPPDLDHLLRRFDEMYESSGTTARVQIEIVSPEKTRTMKLRVWSQGEDHALIVIDAPPRDAGTATLRIEQNLWNYLPKISRTIRVPPSMMMGSWMGTDFTNDDLVHESSYEEDYNAELIGRSEEPPGWHLRLTAKPDVPGLWKRVEIIFGGEHQLPIEIDYYDRKDRLARTMELGDVQQIDGRWITTRMRVIPADEEGEYTELRYLDVDFDADIDESLFSLSELERRW
ncbi:MAG: outer membrane lipoprotein-sorting protein [Candidatus Eisenbacteria bacterium]|nr:outer membrane lipoprotein-sorting protein [Candidatus Eisenbacteria bacterium]